MAMENQHYDCACYSDEHTLRFTLDPEDGDIYASQFMNHWFPWWKRVWVGLRYVFGYKCKYGHFDCWIMRDEDAEKLRGMLDAYLAARAAKRGHC
jgi:hypothetical protein